MSDVCEEETMGDQKMEPCPECGKEPAMSAEYSWFCIKLHWSGPCGDLNGVKWNAVMGAVARIKVLTTEINALVAEQDRNVTASCPGLPDRHCGTCKYYDAERCHRYPPTRECIAASDESPVLGYPFRVTYTQWCGDWIAREATNGTLS